MRGLPVAVDNRVEFLFPVRAVRRFSLNALGRAAHAADHDATVRREFTGVGQGALHPGVEAVGPGGSLRRNARAERFIRARAGSAAKTAA